MANPLVRPDMLAPWTIKDLQDVPDDGNRYEISDGSLQVTPPPPLPHFRTTNSLVDLLRAAALPELVVGENVGIVMAGGVTMRVPDITVLLRSALDRDGLGLAPSDVVLVVEVLSPTNRAEDLLVKRHQYAEAGIPQYWIVDPQPRTLTVLALDGTGRHYEERAVRRPGEPWRADEPFRVDVDPAELF